jgi:hypothetical protein
LDDEDCDCELLDELLLDDELLDDELLEDELLLLSDLYSSTVVDSVNLELLV